jgi:Tat protein secretion system quality control protein TatD with DNase activity
MVHLFHRSRVSCYLLFLIKKSGAKGYIVKMKLFDAHSHMHMGPSGLMIPAAVEQTPFAFDGAAIMSTHPKDYDEVDSIVSGLRNRDYRAVPCYGIHPWFLYDVLTSSDEGDWLGELKQRLIDHPDAIVGEIGLDGNRWVEVEQSDESDESIWKRKRVLACPMELQRKAFEEQLVLATELQRPVSIHVVSAWGELFTAFDNVRERMKRKYEHLEMEVIDEKKKRRRTKRKLLPPKIYFHAFSGKAGALPSVRSACTKGNIPLEDVYFGFPPAIKNFYAAKTPSIMKEIGIRQLLLETDLEDARGAWNDLQRGVKGISTALDMEESEVARQTYENADRFYFRPKSKD